IPFPCASASQTKHPDQAPRHTLLRNKTKVGYCGVGRLDGAPRSFLVLMAHHEIANAPVVVARKKPTLLALLHCLNPSLEPQSSSPSRRTAGASEFFILSQSGERPERYIESLRFDTMPSSPILQAWAKTVGPSPSKCSLKRRPRPALASILRSVALRTSSGSRRMSSHQLDQVEGVAEDTVVVAVVADEIERGNAVVIANDSFAIDDA